VVEEGNGGGDTVLPVNGYCRWRPKLGFLVVAAAEPDDEEAR
jgi:hypothetical protein